MAKIVVDPVTRIEGHLKIEVEVDGGVVVDAHTSGTLFRGIELLLQGRDPRDAQQIVQRICGVCPTTHATAGTLALDSAFGIEPPPNGRIIRNLILGSNYIQSHILHFFHLAALDYVKGPDTPPFTPRYQADYRLPDAVNKQAVDTYLEALNMRRKAHEMLAIFGGKMPHVQAIVPGGVTEIPNAQKIIEFKFRLGELIDFIDNKYIPIVQAVAEAYSDWFSIGTGCKTMLAYGGFPLEEGTDHVAKKKFFPSGILYANGTREKFNPDNISEEVEYSWYDDDTGGLKPSEAVITPAPTKKNAYSWLKSPRYKGTVMEVGPLARMLVMGQKDVAGLGDKAYSVMGRHFARAIEASLVAHAMDEWVTQLQPGQPVCTPHEIKSGLGVGLCEGPRGALGHWHKIEHGRTAVYNAVVPTTWNAGPRDSRGVPGPMEQALIGTPVKDANNPVELVRIVRAFDPCFGCAIHLMTPDKKVLAQFVVG